MNTTRLFFASVAMMTAVTLSAQVTVDPSSVVGQIKPMHGVNNGPVEVGDDQSRGNFDDYAAACIPFARTHDAAFASSYGGEHSVDITGIFPDFSKDPYDPASYDFIMTDRYLKTIREAGTEVFYRLGQKIEHGVKKYGILPPADFKKWAVICEHIIRHYNQGWANGFNWNIRYWEIWNEPDLDSRNEAWKVNPRTWGGSPEQFFDLYTITAKHLKSCFPELKIGGPAIAGDEEWADRFLAHMQKNKVPMDFFSWHIYAVDPVSVSSKADRMRVLMDKYGYKDAESILNEWNYVKGWSTEYPYSVDAMNSIKGACFTASVMQDCQDKPVDILMYYDARVGTIFNTLFDFYSFAPTSCYYPFYAWSKLVKCGQQIKVSGNSDPELHVTAAKDSKGRLGILVTRYTDNNNVVTPKKVKVNVKGMKINEAIGHRTDKHHLFTEVPVKVNGGTIEFSLDPASFIYLSVE